MNITGYLYDATYDPFSNVVRGTIFGDEKKRFEDGSLIRTSSLTSGEPGTSALISTLNSTYRIINWKV